MRNLKTASAIGFVLLLSAGISSACSDPHRNIVPAGANPTGMNAAGTANGGGSGSSGNSSGEAANLGPVGQDDASCLAYAPVRANRLSPVNPDATAKLAQMTQEQKISLLSGGEVCPNYDCDFDGTGIPALGIDDFKMRDGPRGVHQLNGGNATTWAVAEARAAAFDLDLERRVGEAQAKEMLALKYDLSLAPTINTLRHPAWARAQETYGEDPVLVGEMGAAFVNGMQDAGMAACPKHFVANDTDERRNQTSANMDEQTLRENYLRDFQIVVEKADPACIMAAYNAVNSEFSTENSHLLTDVLRTDWKWHGFVLSDWWATKKSGSKTLNSGLDLEMPDKRAFEDLPADLAQQSVTPTRIDEAALRILNARATFGQFSDQYRNKPANPGIVNEQVHKDLARETEEKGAVLLKNVGILPLGAAATTVGYGTPTLTKIAVLGPDAKRPIIGKGAKEPSGLGDRGSSDTNPAYAVSYLDGITARAGAGVQVISSTNAADAAGADVVIIPVTMQHQDEGEAFGGGGDRDTLTLSGIHPLHWNPKPADFIKAVAAVNPKVVVLLAVGSAVVMEDWIDSAPAIVQTFYPGQEGGTAVARLLFGDVNFSGKLPFTVAKDPADYPLFQNLATEVAVDYFHGYRKFEHDSLTPRFWFGFGLSYTKYEYSDLKVLCSTVSDTGRLNFEVKVTNNGPVAGDEIVQVYIGYPHTTARRPAKELKAFARVALQPAESKVVPLNVPVREMAYWEASGGWTVEKVEHAVLVGPSADSATLLSAPFTVQ